MIFPKLKIRIYCKILFLICTQIIILINIGESNSQSKYGFSEKWTWEDMMNEAVLVDPVLIKSVDILKQGITLKDARILLKNLSDLNSLNELTQIYIQPYSETEKNEVKWDSVFRSSFEVNTITEDNLKGLLSSMITLSEIRNSNSENGKFKFHDKGYLSQPGKELKKKIEIDFNYSGAEKVLEFFKDENANAEIVLESEVYKNVTKENDLKVNSNNLSRSELENDLLKSKDNSPLYSIYKWVNPESSGDFGGVNIYKDNFSEILSTIKENEDNIRFDIAKNILKYLPEDNDFKVELIFLFGSKATADDFSKNKIYVNVEDYCDDYNYLVRHLIHEIYKLNEKEIRFDVSEFMLNKKDEEFINLLSKIQINGIANYVGPVGSETRPYDLLEKDFQLFNKTYESIRKGKSKISTDSLKLAGFEGNAPFYTMATQMAYIIETTLGQNSLKESVIIGPVSFFNHYIKSYKDYPDKIRRVFRFSGSLENKIQKFKNKFPDKTVKTAFQIKNSGISDSAILNIRIKDFIKSNFSKNNSELLNILSGKILLDMNYFESADYYFSEGLKLNKDKRNAAHNIGKAFEEKGAMKEAEKYFKIQ